MSPPEQIARRLIERVPEWFLPNAGRDAELAAADRALFEAWILHEEQQTRDRISTLDTLDAAMLVMQRVRRRVRGRPLENRPSADSYAEPEFFERCFARLVFGYTNCEGLAYIVQRLLDASGIKSVLVETDTRFRHSMIVVFDGDGWAILDPYADFPCYVVPGFPILEVLGKRGCKLVPFPNAPTYDSFGFPEGAVIKHGLYPASGALTSRVAPLREGSPPRTALSQAEYALRGRHPKDLGFFTEFLGIRHGHVWGSDATAAVAYSALAEGHRIAGFTRALLGALDQAQA